MYRFYIVCLAFCFYQNKAQTINFSTGVVASYAKYKNDSSSAVLVDTIVGQYRSFAIDTLGKKIGIEWLNENDTIRVQYHIERIYITENSNSLTNKTVKYLNLLSFDNDNYPLLVLFPIEDKDFMYIYYYYWNNKADIFQKSEKIAISSSKNIVLK